MYGCNLLTWWHWNGTIAWSTFASLPTWMSDWIVWCIVRWNLWRNNHRWCSILSIGLPKCSRTTGFQLHSTSPQLRWCWWFCCWWWPNSIWLSWHLFVFKLTSIIHSFFQKLNVVCLFTWTADTRCFCFACKPWPMSSKME